MTLIDLLLFGLTNQSIVKETEGNCLSGKLWFCDKDQCKCVNAVQGCNFYNIDNGSCMFCSVIYELKHQHETDYCQVEVGTLIFLTVFGLLAVAIVIFGVYKSIQYHQKSDSTNLQKDSKDSSKSQKLEKENNCDQNKKQEENEQDRVESKSQNYEMKNCAVEVKDIDRLFASPMRRNNASFRHLLVLFFLCKNVLEKSKYHYFWPQKLDNKSD